MVVHVHDTHGCDMNRFIRKCGRLFHNRQSKNHLILFVCIQFSRQCINITFQHALASILLLQRGILLILNLLLLLDFTICMRATLERFGLRQLHTTIGISSLFFSQFLWAVCLQAFSDLPFCLLRDGSRHWVLLDFLAPPILEFITKTSIIMYNDDIMVLLWHFLPLFSSLITRQNRGVLSGLPNLTWAAAKNCVSSAFELWQAPLWSFLFIVRICV